MIEPKRVVSAALVWVFFGASLVSALPDDIVGEQPPQPVLTSSGGISMDFESVPLKDVLKIFSQQSGLNFVAHEAIQAKLVSVYFEDVSVEDAMDSLLKANNLTYVRGDGSSVYVVYPVGAIAPQLKTEIFFLKFCRLSTSPLDTGGRTTIADLAKITAIGDKEKKSSTVSTASQSDRSPKAATGKGIDLLVASLLSDQGRLTVDLNTNSLIVTDTAERLEEVKRILLSIDIPPPQVLLQVHLMEVKKDLMEDIGLEWGGTDGEILSLTGASRTTQLPFSSGLFKKDLDLDITANPIGTVTAGSIDASNFGAVLHFIRTHTDTKILAQPRILTQSNEAAIIKLVTDAAIANTSSTVTAEGTAVTSANTAERTEVGINLKMTPQINEDSSISLFLEPTVTTVAPSTFFPTIFLDPTRRSVRTMVRVKNHETIVIGGLIDYNKTQADRKIPYLGDVPVIGNAFKYRSGEGQDRELLIFITPHLVNNDAELRDITLSNARQRDLSMQRVLNAFMNEELDKAMGSLPKSARSAVTPSKEAGLERQMTHTLDALDTKSPKLNR